MAYVQKTYSNHIRLSSLFLPSVVGYRKNGICRKSTYHIIQNILFVMLLAFTSTSNAKSSVCFTRDGASVLSTWTNFPDTLAIDGVVMDLISEDSHNNGNGMYIFSIRDSYLVATIVHDGPVYSVSIPGPYSNFYYVCKK